MPAHLVAFEAVARDAVGLVHPLALFGLVRDVESLCERRPGAEQHGQEEKDTDRAGPSHAGHPTSGG